jgi:hypothetical protein
LAGPGWVGEAGSRSAVELCRGQKRPTFPMEPEQKHQEPAHRQTEPGTGIPIHIIVFSYE